MLALLVEISPEGDDLGRVCQQKALKTGSTHKSYRLLEADPPDPAVGRRLFIVLTWTVRD